MKYICPMCGCEDCNIVYKFRTAEEIIGCDNCIRLYSIDELDQMRKEAAEDMKLDESRGK